ncbi:MAG: arylsulfatase A family [Candidatus Nanosalina sp. J07AB43]|nr:MAG: arylsulfatase A family [Candidatus Nanosalina sp. J07AB43]
MEDKNFVLLVVDALRRDHVSCYGYDRNTTPFLDDFAEHNTKLENFWSTSSHTREAVPSMLTGYYPDEAVNQSYEISEASIQQELNQKSAAFHSNPFISRAYGYQEGFDRFHDGLNRGDNKILRLGKRLIDKFRDDHYERASKINRLSLDWIDSQSDNFFVWNQYMDVHGPYEPQKDFRGIYQDDVISDRRSQILLQKARKRPESISKSQRQRLIDLYDEEIKYVDSKIEEFINELKRRGMYQDSVIIITSDHGEAFGEGGFYEHPRKLSDGLLQIPFLSKGLDIDEDITGSLVDVYPTLSGSEREGESLEDKKKDETVYSQVTEKGSETNGYGAMNGEDSYYVSCRPNHKLDSDNMLSEKLQKFISDKDEENKDENIESKDEEIKDRLEALGYGD